MENKLNIRIFIYSYEIETYLNILLQCIIPRYNIYCQYLRLKCSNQGNLKTLISWMHIQGTIKPSYIYHWTVNKLLWTLLSLPLFVLVFVFVFVFEFVFPWEIESLGASVCIPPSFGNCIDRQPTSVSWFV